MWLPPNLYGFHCKKLVEEAQSMIRPLRSKASEEFRETSCLEIVDRKRVAGEREQ